MAADPPENVARDLSRAGYAKLFGAGDRSCAASIWRDGENRDSLAQVVRGDAFDPLARVLASEVLYRHDDDYPPAGWEDTLGPVYAEALEITGTGDRPIVLTGNLWGFLSYGDERGARHDGPLGAHLLEAGPAAISHLVELLDDSASLFYEGSRDAFLGSSLRHRVKDAAAYYIGRLTESPVVLHEDLAERDAQIDRLRAAATGHA